MDPVFETHAILSYALGVDRSYLLTHPEEEINPEKEALILRYLDQRSGGKPFQYITGVQEFMGLDFQVNEHVLIPRRETERLVETVIDIVKRRCDLDGEKFELLDMCCGSGAIGLSLAKFLPVKMTLVDISRNALSVAKKNAYDFKIENNVTFIESNLFAKIPKGIAFDGIISNPPYIPDQEIEVLQKEVKDHEPMLALAGGADGLDFYRKIIDVAPDYLSEGGFLALEIGWDQGDVIKAPLAAEFQGVEVIKDYNGKDRIVIGYKKVL